MAATEDSVRPVSTECSRAVAADDDDDGLLCFTNRRVDCAAWLLLQLSGATPRTGNILSRAVLSPNPKSWFSLRMQSW